jgi:hypothetical protein
MPRAVLPVRRLFRSTAKLGKSCGCRAIAIGRTAWSVISFSCPPLRWLRPGLNRRQRFAADLGLKTSQPLIGRNQFDDRAPRVNKLLKGQAAACIEVDFGSRQEINIHLPLPSLESFEFRRCINGDNRMVVASKVAQIPHSQICCDDIASGGFYR